MDRQIDGLAGAMRQIAEQRDSQLCEAEAISPDRLEQLQAFLAAALPVETALLAAARRRDASLGLTQPSLPAAVHLALVEQAVRVSGHPAGIFWSLVAWFQRSDLAALSRTAAAAALAVALAWTGLHFSSSRHSAAQISQESAGASNVNPWPAAFSNRDAFKRSANDLTLGVSRIDLASLDPSLLTNGRAFPDLALPDRGLLLDLPIRQIRLDVEAMRTP
ncbi:MAG TPA: hypothetical protein VJU77_14035 [Chthoniobacterales bacterium]|nr:hypothetical protein [Chthoniobacterales bacterium]